MTDFSLILTINGGLDHIQAYYFNTIMHLFNFKCDFINFS